MVVRPFQTILDLALQYAGSIEASFDINPEITAKPLQVDLSIPEVLNKKVVDSYNSNQVYPATLGLIEESWAVEFEPDYSVGGGDVQIEIIYDNPYINVQSSLVVDKFANTHPIEIYTNRAFELSTNADWLLVQANNQFDATLSIFVDHNTTGQTRTGYITIVSVDNSALKQITITQNG